MAQPPPPPPPPPPSFPCRKPGDVSRASPDGHMPPAKTVGDNGNGENAESKHVCNEGVPSVVGVSSGVGVSPKRSTRAEASTGATAEFRLRAMAGATAQSAPVTQNIPQNRSGQSNSSAATGTRSRSYKHPTGEVLASSAREYLALPAGGELSVEFRMMKDSSSRTGRGTEGEALGRAASSLRVDENTSHVGGIEGDGGWDRAFTPAQGFLEVHKL